VRSKRRGRIVRLVSSVTSWELIESEQQSQPTTVKTILVEVKEKDRTEELVTHRKRVKSARA
jgi:hypothetical protein